VGVEVQPDAPRVVRRRWLAPGVAALALALTAVVSYHQGAAGRAGAPPPTAAATPSATAEPSTAQIYTAVTPSVVSVSAVRRGTRTIHVTGTGVIVNADATVITALHVVKGGSSIRVTFADGTTSRATVAASDPTRDIATLAPDRLPSVVVPALLGSAGRLSVGDRVVAVGNQLGLTFTTTTGVVSGLDRAATGDDGTGLSGLIQFDAAVNHGSSGGPLLNGNGETVGIVVALANPTDDGTFIGIGFAVPIGAAVAGGGGQGPLQ
jgi:S1-C subfamily serine protease